MLLSNKKIQFESGGRGIRYCLIEYGSIRKILVIQFNERGSNRYEYCQKPGCKFSRSNEREGMPVCKLKTPFARYGAARREGIPALIHGEYIFLNNQRSRLNWNSTVQFRTHPFIHLIQAKTCDQFGKFFHLRHANVTFKSRLLQPKGHAITHQRSTLCIVCEGYRIGIWRWLKAVPKNIFGLKF